MKKSKTKTRKSKAAAPSRARAASPSNDFCQMDDLTNEATVEQFFASRLLTRLGYRDNQIKPKTSLDELVVNLGRRKLKYRPDYALVIAKKIRWIVEAKAPSEALDEHIGQCSGYCLALNRGYTDNPVEFFLLTNGATTELYRWDQEEPILTLDFDDFVEGNKKFEKLLGMLVPERFTGRRATTRGAKEDTHVLNRRTIEEVNADFTWCHQFIHKKDALSQSAAFLEFVKLIFLKLLSDKAVRERHPEMVAAPKLEVPAEEVRFSTRWLDSRQGDHPSPLDALQFRDLVNGLESEIRSGTRKRIFDTNAQLTLRPDTIRGVVARLEHTDLYSIDADLNGRLFETFLNATMRGKDLGQFFTPRTVIKLAVRLADIQVGRRHTDVVLDACSGTGGFLIDALATMWGKVEANTSLSKREQATLKQSIATEKIIGIDVAADPPLARIARMNMYLHGDGGTRIYQADALDKGAAEDRHNPPEIAAEKTELRRLMTDEGFADVVLTNPPFAKEYTRKEGDGPLLDRYALAFVTEGGRRKPRPSLRSSVMFLERYHDMLRPGGRMITIIDDSILGGRDYRQMRDFIRSKFIVRAVVSLPGDAFQRSNARVKTSLLYVVKRSSEEEEQPPLLMTYCTAVGLDDPARQRVLPIDKRNRVRAREEVERIGDLFDAFMAGDRAAAPWIVQPEAIADRMDVKHCLLRPGRLVSKWRRATGICKLGDLVDICWPLPDVEGGGSRYPEADEQAAEPMPRVKDSGSIESPASFAGSRYLRVRYDGFAEAGEEIQDRPEPMFRVKAGDVVISHINAVHGAVAVVPAEFDGLVVTSEFTVCRPKKGIDARVVWSLLRSPEARADFLITATGIGRTRVKTDQAINLDLPVVEPSVAAPLVKALQRAEHLELEARELRERARTDFEAKFGLANEKAREIIAAFKPPD